MIINPNSQLGIRFLHKDTKRECMIMYHNSLKKKSELYDARKIELEDIVKRFDRIINEPDSLTEEEKEEILSLEEITKNLIQKSTITENFNDKEKQERYNHFIQNYFLNDTGKMFLICDSVYKAAELIKVSTGFTGRAMKTIKPGSYSYLMGKHEMMKFVVNEGLLRGLHINEKDKMCLEFGIDLETGDYFFDEGKEEAFTRLMQVMIFVELGDIEVIELPSGRNNGLPKSSGKITNQTPNTVFVVDSTWNKIIIRTDGFAVRGHFRLQPCGDGMKDRKLLWIHAFEKHGYKRMPKAQIVK